MHVELSLNKIKLKSSKIKIKMCARTYVGATVSEKMYSWAMDVYFLFNSTHFNPFGL